MSFVLSYCSTDVFFLFFLFPSGGYNEICQLTLCMESRILLPFLWASYIIFHGLFRQSGSFALSAVMGCTGIALFPRSTLTYGLQ